MKSILSIDGGGIRGIIPGMVLVELEEKLKSHTNSPEARIPDYFDFFAGTSSGAILISILLTPSAEDKNLPKYSARDAVGFYLKHGAEIFKSSFFKKILAKFGLVTEKFNDEGLNKLFRQYFGDTKLSELLKPCIVTAYNTELRKAHFFRQQSARNKCLPKDFLVRDICRASTAAPSFFSPAEIYSLSGTRYPFIDGGIFANNPSLVGIIEVSKIRHSANPGEMIILSLGTGTSTKAFHYHKLRNTRAIWAVRSLTNMILSGMSETTDFIIREFFKISKQSSHYLRINTRDLSSVDEAIDNATELNMQKLKALGERIATEYSDDLDVLVDLLLEERNKTENVK